MWTETFTMNSVAVLCVLVLVLNPVWSKSVPETDERLNRRADEFDVTKLSDDELNRFIEHARIGLKRAIGKW